MKLSLTCQMKIEKSQILFEIQVMGTKFLKLIQRWVIDALKLKKMIKCFFATI